MIPRRRIALGAAELAALAAAPFQPRDVARRAVSEFESAFSACLDGRHALATASGRDALELILDGLGLTAGDEVIVPAYTLGELLALFRRRGLVPRAADIDPASLNLTANAVATRLGPRSRAILALHVFGAPCDITAIAELAARHGVALVEDCAHALGASVGGLPVGGFGRAALFSFEVTKQLPTFGGGMVVTDDAQLAGRIRQRLAARPLHAWPALRKALLRGAEELAVRSPLYALAAPLLFGDGRAAGFERFYRGLGDRVRSEAAYSGFQARLAAGRLAGLAARNARLNARWQRLAAALPERLRPQARDRHGAPAFYNFVALFDGDAVTLRRHARSLGVDLAVGGELLDDVALALGQDDCPAARHAAAHAVQLPLYDGLSERRFERLVAALGRAVEAV